MYASQLTYCFAWILCFGIILALILMQELVEKPELVRKSCKTLKVEKEKQNDYAKGISKA